MRENNVSDLQAILNAQNFQNLQNLQISPGCYPVQPDLETRNSSDHRVGRAHLVAGDEVPVAGSHHREELQQVVKAVQGRFLLDIPDNTGVKLIQKSVK